MSRKHRLVKKELKKGCILMVAEVSVMQNCINQIAVFFKIMTTLSRSSSMAIKNNPSEFYV